MNYDLNCDLGEGEPPSRTAALLRKATSANIACGGHAGNVQTMRLAIQLALRYNVRIGTHPGLNDRTGFGRTSGRISDSELELLLLHQVGGFEKLLQREGARLHHIKLHGALYHMVENSKMLCRAYLGAVKQYWPTAIIYARAGGNVQQA